MIRFDILTIFPDIFTSYIHESILGRAQKSGLVKINPIDLRKYTKDKHRTTDDKPYSGGPGMVMKVEPIYEAVVENSMFKTGVTKKGLTHAKSQRIILLSASGKQFTQQKAEELKKYKQIMLIAGRYEGVDERVAEFIADEEISVGPYVLSGGELPSLIIVEAVARLVRGVLGNEKSLQEESFAFANNKSQIANGKKTISHKPFVIGQREYPQYTRPEIFSPKRGIEWKVPGVLLSGDHKKIEEWRREQQK